MRRAVDLQPQDSQLRYYMATVYQERGKPAAAAAEFEAALRLLRAHPPLASGDRQLWLSYLEGAHFNLAQLLQAQGQTKRAAGHLAEFHHLSDAHVRANHQRAHSR
jgi:tetratricopeptide (TPR) repeat protein